MRFPDRAEVQNQKTSLVGGEKKKRKKNCVWGRKENKNKGIATDWRLPDQKLEVNNKHNVVFFEKPHF